MTMNTMTDNALGDRMLPLAGDTDDVRWALETAQAVFQSGDRCEALRWLRRAAETAAEEGLDLRAVQLAKAAADLRAALDLPPTTPPPPQSDRAAEILPAHEPGVISAALPHASGEPSRRLLHTSPGLSPDYDARTSSAPPPSAESDVVAHAPRASLSSANLSALRVAVQRAADGSLAVSVLAKGQAVPKDAHEAVLVAVSPDVTL